MSKGDNLNFLKTQTCVLKVNIHCEGCKQKVKKLLQKIDGVFTISVDSEHGKVTVTGSVDPATLIKKLSKAGKHAELLVPKGGGGGGGGVGGGGGNNKNNPNNFLQEQLQKLQLQAGKGQHKDQGNPQKGGGGGGGGVKDQKGQQLPQQVQQMKGFQDLKLPQLKDFKFPPPQKEQKNVKFSVPIEDFDDDEGSEFDDDDNMYDSEYDDDYDDDGLDGIDDFEDFPKQSNMKPVKDQKKGGNVKGDGEKDRKGGGGGGGGAKQGGGDNNNKSAPNGNDKGNYNAQNNGGKKGGGKSEGQPMNSNPKMMMGQKGIQGMDMGRMKAPMGPMSLQSVGGMPPGNYQGGMAAPEMMAAPTNSYQQQLQQLQQQQQQQQQYTAAMQQRMMMNGPMPYGQPQMAYGQPMSYMPPPPAYGEPAYTHYFSDENANSCSIM